MLEGLLYAALFSIGGLIGYFARGIIDERFRERAEARREEQKIRTEARKARRKEAEERRELLLEFLGQPRAHFQWLYSAHSDRIVEGSGDPPPHEKVRMITEWIYCNRARYPKEIREELNVLLHVAYALLEPGCRTYVWARSGPGVADVHNAWDRLKEYEEDLETQLTAAEK